MPKLDDRWNPGLWLGISLASDEHYVGTSARVRRCRSIWRRPEKQRWDRKVLTEMNGEPWNPTAHHQDRPPQVRGVYVTLERQIKHGGTKGCAACFGHAKVRSPECRARFQDIVDNVAAQTAAASASEPNVEMQEQAAGGSAASSSRGLVPAAGRPAPEDANMEPAESSAAQPTSSVVRTLDAEDDGSAKRQRLMAGMPILDETPEDPEAVRSRLVATQVNTYAREDVSDTTNQSAQNHCESSCNQNKCEETTRLFDCQTRHSSGVFPCEGERASRDHSSKGTGTTRSRLDMCESVVWNTRGDQVLWK